MSASTSFCSDPLLPGKRIRELIAEEGYAGSILDDYLREIRPLFLPRRTYQRTVYRSAELLQSDLFEPRSEIPRALCTQAMEVRATSSPPSAASSRSAG